MRTVFFCFLGSKIPTSSENINELIHSLFLCLVTNTSLCCLQYTVQACFHCMEVLYGYDDEKSSRVGMLQMVGNFGFPRSGIPTR